MIHLAPADVLGSANSELIYAAALVLVALIAGGFGFAGPLLIQRGQSELRTKERAEDKAERDAVALEARAAAAKLVASNEEVATQARDAADKLVASNEAVAAEARTAAAKLVASNAEVAAAAKETGAQTLAAVGVIHTLVNSTLTAAIEDSLASAQAHVASLLELAQLRKSTPEQVAALATAKSKVAELRVKLADRRRQAELAETQIVAEGKRAAEAEPET